MKRLPTDSLNLPEIRANRELEFKSYMEDRGVDTNVTDLIVARMSRLNKEIRDQKTNLGAGFEIGHSFFCPQETDESLDIDWYRSVILEEIAPLLREYWFDEPDKADEQAARLLAK